MRSTSSSVVAKFLSEHGNLMPGDAERTLALLVVSTRILAVLGFVLRFESVVEFGGIFGAVYAGGLRSLVGTFYQALNKLFSSHTKIFPTKKCSHTEHSQSTVLKRAFDVAGF